MSIKRAKEKGYIRQSREKELKEKIKRQFKYLVKEYNAYKDCFIYDINNLEDLYNELIEILDNKNKGM